LAAGGKGGVGAQVSDGRAVPGEVREVRGQRIVEDQASRHYRRTGKWPRQVTERIGVAGKQPLPYRGAPTQCIVR
jgi:hypothetical protein